MASYLVLRHCILLCVCTDACSLKLLVNVDTGKVSPHALSINLSVFIPILLPSLMILSAFSNFSNLLEGQSLSIVSDVCLGPDIRTGLPVPHQFGSIPFLSIISQTVESPAKVASQLLSIQLYHTSAFLILPCSTNIVLASNAFFTLFIHPIPVFSIIMKICCFH